MTITFTFTYLLILVLCIGGILLAQKVYREIRTKRTFQQKHDDVSNDIPIDPANRPQVEVLLFFAEWCPACQKIKTQWNAFHDTYTSNPAAHIREHRVHCRKVDCSYYDTNEQLQSLMNSYRIESFPSVVMLVPIQGSTTAETTYVRFSGRITKQNLETFVSDTLSSTS
jgi:thiol-disulfide isomerase/thioredoxin